MLSHIVDSSTVLATTNCEASEVDGELIILFLKSGKYFGLNPVSTWIWRQIQVPRRVGEMCNEILGEFEVGQDQAREELIAFLHELANEELIEVRN